MSKVELLNCDCMEYMKGLPDKAFDLAIVDPPYNIASQQKRGVGSRIDKTGKMNEWNNKTPDPVYFDELFRVSKNQIIWGANNYYGLPITEYAWVSPGLKMPAKVFDYSIHQHNCDIDRIHPTQKPVKLYKWLLHNYAKPVCNNKHTEEYKSLCTDCNKPFRILDTHLGSGSSAIAAHSMGFDFVGCELDKDYYDAACKRFREQTMQQKLFI